MLISSHSQQIYNCKRYNLSMHTRTHTLTRTHSQACYTNAIYAVHTCTCIHVGLLGYTFHSTVEPLYNEVLGTMKFTLLYQVFHYVRVKKQRNIKIWDQQNYLVIRGFCYIRPRYNEVPLYNSFYKICTHFYYLIQQFVCEFVFHIYMYACIVLYCNPNM